MSYLVDALKKAERERHAHRNDDLYAAATGTAHAPADSRAGPWLWLIAMLVASNVALAVYVWRPRTSQPPAVPTISTARVQTPMAAESRPVVTTPAVNQATQRTSPQSAVSSRIASTDRLESARRDARQTERSPASRPASAAPKTASGTASAGRGSVTYSKTPLTDDNSTSATARSANSGSHGLPDQAGVGGVPSVTINGQLYSTVPGRSFILVGGRRYHEGERLASGPAVESIRPNGATLLYKGQRYHVAGPG